MILFHVKFPLVLPSVFIACLWQGEDLVFPSFSHYPPMHIVKHCFSYVKKYIFSIFLLSVHSIKYINFNWDSRNILLRARWSSIHVSAWFWKHLKLSCWSNIFNAWEIISSQSLDALMHEWLSCSSFNSKNLQLHHIIFHNLTSIVCNQISQSIGDL